MWSNAEGPARNGQAQNPAHRRADKTHQEADEI